MHQSCVSWRWSLGGAHFSSNAEKGQGPETGPKPSFRRRLFFSQYIPVLLMPPAALCLFIFLSPHDRSEVSSDPRTSHTPPHRSLSAAVKYFVPGGADDSENEGSRSLVLLVIHSFSLHVRAFKASKGFWGRTVDLEHPGKPGSNWENIQKRPSAPLVIMDFLKNLLNNSSLYTKRPLL